MVYVVIKNRQIYKNIFKPARNGCFIQSRCIFFVLNTAKPSI